MGYTGFERLWLFFAFNAFSGWVLETVTAAVRQRRFVNRGLVRARSLCFTVYGNRDACCLPGTAWNLAVSRQYDLFDPGGVDRWPCDREDVP